MQDSFVARIRQRKVFQWAAAYLASGWLALQVLQLVRETFGWPTLIQQIALVLLPMGLLAVLVLAWYHGETGAQKVTAPELVMLAGILVVAGGAVSALSSAASLGAPAAEAGTVAFPVVERSSIAVLPFADMSPARDQEYFSDGLTEELLSVLAKIPDLRVAARTSSFAFKGRNVQVDSIGRALRVAHLLDGSVRRDGDRLRITAQLINAETGYQLWSGAYDRELEDVFAIQSEIAGEIGRVLQTELRSDQNGSPASGQSRDLVAYDLYLQGRYMWNRRSEEALRRAIQHFQEAIQHDPNYAAAFAGLAASWVVLPEYGSVSSTEAWPRARSAVEEALRLDPQLGAAHAVLGYGIMHHEWDWDAAEAELLRAVELDPKDAVARQWYGDFLYSRGRLDEALEQLRYARDLDPLSPVIGTDFGWTLYVLGRYEEAAEELRRIISIAPSYASAHLHLGSTYLRQGHAREAIAQIETAVELRRRSARDVGTLAYAHARTGNTAAARQLLDELLRRRTTEHVLDSAIALAYTGLGDLEQALFWLLRAAEAREGWLAENLFEPMLDPVRAHPSFPELAPHFGL